MKVVNGVNFTVTEPGHYAYVPGEQPLLVRLSDVSAPAKRERSRAPRAKSSPTDRTHNVQTAERELSGGARHALAEIRAGRQPKMLGKMRKALSERGLIHQNSDGAWIASVPGSSNGVRAEA